MYRQNQDDHVALRSSTGHVDDDGSCGSLAFQFLVVKVRGEKKKSAALSVLKVRATGEERTGEGR